MARGSVAKRRADYAAYFTRFAILAMVAQLQRVAVCMPLQD
jgi:hypothetical protein